MEVRPFFVRTNKENIAKVKGGPGEGLGGATSLERVQLVSLVDGKEPPSEVGGCELLVLEAQESHIDSSEIANDTPACRRGGSEKERVVSGERGGECRGWK